VLVGARLSYPINAVAFGKLTIAEISSVLLLELKVEYDTFSKLTKPGLVENIMEVAFCSP
jgi:hypothetical protein